MADEKPKVKKPVLQVVREALAQQVQELGGGLMQRLAGLPVPWANHRDMAGNNYELGLEHLQQGHLKDAILRFKIVTWRQPGNADAWYYLGSSYLANGEKAPAAHALAKALQLKPRHEEAAYLLAIARGDATPPEQLPKKIPLTLMRQHFDGMAPGFSQAQLDTYQYAGHRLLAAALRQCMQPGRIDHVILELGVGSGLLGPLLRDVAANITGIDLSASMLAEAMKVQDEGGKKIYDALVHREMEALLPEAADEAFDVVAAAGVFSYTGDLQETFAQCARALKRGGLFAFTADRMDGHGFRFDPDAARFRFSKSYLQDLAATSGLKEVHVGEGEIYPGDVAWVCVFTRS